MTYPLRAGMESERLALIWEIYNWTGSSASGQSYGYSPYGQPKQAINKNREHPIAWDLCQIFAAIAGGYVIELSSHYKGVQLVRKNKALWERVSKFVKLKVGEGCLPYDSGSTGAHWEQVNGVHFFDVQT
jgi:hypothetical protein